jgi:7-cyano-7-deazaguanine synthase
VVQKKAIVLLSGGLDSATTLAIARNENYHCYALTFIYGQRHEREAKSAEKVATSISVIEHRIIKIGLSAFGGSAITDSKIDVPKDRENLENYNEIPITYVPARNTIFLSYALAWAEVLEAFDI